LVAFFKFTGFGIFLGDLFYWFWDLSWWPLLVTFSWWPFLVAFLGSLSWWPFSG
jgi:hypothetical protein